MSVPMMTNQEIFDKVVAHLRKQGKRAVDSRGGCRYRDDELKCAAGCLILDEHYTAGLERKSAFHIEVVKALSASGVPESAMRLISELQDCHDNIEVEDWEDSLRAIAATFRLSYAPPLEAP